MKIVFITTLYPDNKEQTLTNVPYALHYFVQNWVKQNHTVEVIKIEATYPWYLPQYYKINRQRKERNVQIDDVNLHVIQVKKEINRRFSKSSAKQSAKNVLDYLSSKHIQYDAVVFHVYEPGFYIASTISKKLNIPAIWGFHQSDINWIKTSKNIKDLNQGFADISAIAFRSNSLKSEFEKHYTREIMSFTIASGIPKNIIRKPTENKSFNNTRFITVSNMIKRKNLDILIKSFSKLHKENEEITLKILGYGAEMDNLKALTAQLKLENQISFLGYCERDRVFEELKCSDVFVLPSVDETFGIVYLEAMSQGCIPIGTLGEGIDGIIVHKKNGYLCAPDIDSCYNNMKSAMRLNTVQNRDMRREIYETAVEYTEEKCAEHYILKIQEALNTCKSNS